MSEIIVATTGGSSGITPTELHIRRVLGGDMESVRARLIPALESLGYTVLSEDPLQSYRAPCGWAASYMSNDILDYGIKLNIALKQASASVVRATLSYSVAHPYLTKGDHRTIAREADAVVALAAVRGAVGTCSACGADATGDSRFCRVCGAPLASGVQAELEVLRLTAGARAAHQNIVTAVILFLCALPMLLISIFGTKSNALTIGLILFSLIALPGIITLLFGIRRLHRTLNPASTQPLALPAPLDAAASHANPTAHAPRPAELAAHTTSPVPFSITEGTTELLYAERATPTTDKHIGERRDDAAL
jgi:hypothetical protein